MTYRTSQIAKQIGVHPNTIRFYEEVGLLPRIPRTEKGYRIFEEAHLEQLRLLRVAFRAEIISSKLRQEAFEIVKTAGAGDIEAAYLRTLAYKEHLKKEKDGAEEAVRITLHIIEKENENGMIETSEAAVICGRNMAAAKLGITADVLRDWERNGLILVPQNAKGHREYGITEVNRLKIIRTLRSAHYSMMAILRMLNRLDIGETNIKEIINTPETDEDIICAADRYITALSMAEKDVEEMLLLLSKRRSKKTRIS